MWNPTGLAHEAAKTWLHVKNLFKNCMLCYASNSLQHIKIQGRGHPEHMTSKRVSCKIGQVLSHLQGSENPGRNCSILARFWKVPSLLYTEIGKVQTSRLLGAWAMQMPWLGFGPKACEFKGLMRKVGNWEHQRQNETLPRFKTYRSHSGNPKKRKHHVRHLIPPS